MYLWAIPTLVILGYSGAKYKEILNGKRENVVQYTFLGVVAVFIILFLISADETSYIMKLFPVVLAMEGIYHKRNRLGVLLTFGIQLTQLLMAIYIFYYPYNSAWIPVQGPLNTNFFVLNLSPFVFCGFSLLAYTVKVRNIDHEGDAHKEEDDEEDDFYAKPNTENEVGVIPTTPSIAATDNLDQ